jgi:hypothetical protein
MVLVGLAVAGLAAEEVQRRASGRADFGLDPGPLTSARVAAAFGNGEVVANRDFAEAQGSQLRVTFKEGKKVMGTGVGAYPRLPPSRTAWMEYRIRYPEDFQVGLHGKQLGLSGGRGYDGGRGQEARDNGDGWSIRMQFDSRADAVTNQLYVYQCEMPGKYGTSMGTDKLRFALKRGEWNTIRMRVTMQSEASANDGRIEVWQNGELRFDVTGVRFVRKEEGRVIDLLRVEMFPGGGGEFPAKDEIIEVDSIRWGTGEVTW